ncbi:MAG: hypothetical protein HY220_01325 [Candidatus Sungbacteria bacterium]|uniref:Transcriptional repressor PaaX-like central Cas2-like domain-containing protein n=1 Tax=Candidatus Sungiibacteriota bacterium TaxID=2750080 RepID=A0A9D6LPQ0_9BACT|nr:hypothetical protein [Candidatus Sungbacteria bacterium]
MKGDTEKGAVVKSILAALTGGALGVAAATLPGLAIALKPFISKSRQLKKRSLEQALRRLRRRRLIEIRMDKNRHEVLAITEAGKTRLKKFEFENLELAKFKSWDGYWNVILFDIPERHKTARDALRRKICDLGCFQFHKSVFVHPSPCEDEVDFIASVFRIREFVTVLRTKSLGHQEYRVYKHFGMMPK